MHKIEIILDSAVHRILQPTHCSLLQRNLYSTLERSDKGPKQINSEYQATVFNYYRVSFAIPCVANKEDTAAVAGGNTPPAPCSCTGINLEKNCR